MSFEKILLKFIWPTLKFYDLKEIGGYYTKHGEDIVLNVLLHSNLLKNQNSHIIEINKPESYSFSIATSLINFYDCNATLVNTKSNKHLIVAKLKEGDPGITNSLNYNDTYGCGGIKSGYSKIEKMFEVNNVECLFHGDLPNNLHIIAQYEDSSIIKIFDILKNLKISSLLLINNSDGLFRSGSRSIRRILLSEGYVYYARINGHADLFILSELLNGFPSELFKKLNIQSLQKWINLPPENDFTKPR